MAHAFVLPQESIAPQVAAPQPRPVPDGLLALGPEWSRVDHVRVGSHVVDHVVVGPNGVFAVSVDPDDADATITSDGIIRNGERLKLPVKAALVAAGKLRSRFGEHVLPYPVLVTAVSGRGWLGRLGIAGPETCGDLIWSHPGRPLTRSQRNEVLWALGGLARRS